MSWLRLKDLVASASTNNNKMLGVTSGNAIVAVTAEDMVEKAISSSTTVQTAFNTQTSNAIQNDNSVKQVFNNQVGDAIQNDNTVNNVFNSQVTNAITNDPGTQAAMTTQVTNVNNNSSTTVTYTNPPVVNGKPVLALPTSKNDGDHLMYDGLGTTDVSSKKLLIKASAAEKTQLVNFGQASSSARTAQTFQRILTDFYRFSFLSGLNHGGRAVNHSGTIKNEEQDWVINNSTNEITQGINSHSTIGFASPKGEEYDSYDAIVQFKSTGQDNDMIGWVVSLNRGNPNDINANTPSDSALLLERDLNQGSGLYLVIRNGDGTATAVQNNKARFPFGASSSSGGNWPNYNGCPVKVERRPGTLKIWGIDNTSTTPGWDDPSWGTPIFDLTFTGSIAPFASPGSWGLCARSQGLCSWGDLFFNGVKEGGLELSPKPDPTTNNLVFDIESGNTYTYSNGSWVSDPQSRTIHDYVDSGQLLFDTASKGLYIKDNGELQLLQSSRMDGVVLSANSGITVNDIGKLIVAGPGCSTLTFNGNYGLGWNCVILNKSNASLKIETDGGSRFGDRGLGQPDTYIMLENGGEARCYGNGHNSGANIQVGMTGGNYGV